MADDQLGGVRRPHLTNSFSIGNVITLAVLLVGGAVAWGTQKAETENLRVAVTDLKAEISEMQRDSVTSARERSSLREGMAEMKADVRYIRQLLERWPRAPAR